MTIQEAKKVLTIHQEWRLGELKTMIHPQILTDAIDTILSQLPQQETLYTEEQVREVIDMSRQTKEVDGIRFPIPKYTEQEIIQSLKQPKKD